MRRPPNEDMRRGSILQREMPPLSSSILERSSSGEKLEEPNGKLQKGKEMGGATEDERASDFRHPQEGAR